MLCPLEAMVRGPLGATPKLLANVTSLVGFACPGLVLTGWSVACRTGTAEARLQDRQTQQFLHHSRSLEHGAWHSGLETDALLTASQQETRDFVQRSNRSSPHCSQRRHCLTFYTAKSMLLLIAASVCHKITLTVGILRIDVVSSRRPASVCLS